MGLLALAAIAGAFSVVSNDNFGWPIVFEYFTSPRILSGLVRTLHLTALSMAIGIVLGVILALMNMSRNRFVKSIAWGYIWFFRGTPVFVQLLFWGSISALYPKLIVGLPFDGPTWLEMSANDLITPYIAAVLGLGLNEAAYMAEIVRAGIKSVDRGQSEAATALGMPDGLTTRRVVLPQAMRVIIPPTGNQLIGMLKTSSLVAVLAYPELLYSAQLIYAVNYQTIPLLITASLWYLLITSVLSVGQYYLERHFGRSEVRSSLEA
ncbi:amino acid ABC transporter permease [Ornithinimicrobium faecis]|uniref:amino acid ABC transporter permease n=1 Tax=Ornithinimicrobium faecis TaxID=2934158 RepID=UPI002118B15E|nr:amino acid ABC transporter permease [Ornithinimicrobium sp. HY1745]